MPKTNTDYSKTVIYKIVCNNLFIFETYTGHTTHLRLRKSQHKNACNNPTNKSYNFKLYEFIRANGGWDNWSMLWIEDFPCNNDNEARLRERYWYEKLNSQLNSIVPIRSKEQLTEYKKNYYKNNKEQIAEQKKTNYENNKEEILEKMKQKITCCCGSTCRLGLKARHERSKKHINYLQLNTEHNAIITTP